MKDQQPEQPEQPGSWCCRPAPPSLGFWMLLLWPILFGGCSEQPASRRVLVIGMDGMDPVLLQRYMDAGLLPHFKTLSEKGSFRPLATSMPPQSPVAWSNMISGCDPGTHEIYDFIHRDPNPVDSGVAVAPYLSTSSIEAASVRRELAWGDWHIPLSADKVVLRREGPTFWQFLLEQGIDATIYRMPANYPAGDAHGSGHLCCLTGMGTPDLLGSYGEFTLFSAIAPPEGRSVSGGRFKQLRAIKNRAEIELEGPLNFLRRAGPDGVVPPLTTSVEVVRDPDRDLVKIAVGDSIHILRAGEWSNWTPVVFETGIPGSTALSALQAPTSINGMVRFYIKEVRPVLEVFVTPINIDPLDPVNAISVPGGFATQLARQTGRFFTTGIPEHTAEVQQGALSEDQWLQKTNLILRERILQYRRALRDFKEGCLFFYFGTPDQVSHIFWRDQDPDHPGRDQRQGDQYAKVIENTYVKMDELVGEAVAALADEDVLLIMSDHGFASFRRGFNLNTWLANQGYLQRGASSDGSDGLPFSGVDWSKSTAYGLGLNGLYLNLRGREKFGIVPDGDERDLLLSRLSNELLQVRDSDGTQVIAKVYNTREDYPHADPRIAPDLLIGYAPNYRAGWDTLLGGFSPQVLEDNHDRWSGDHCIAAEFVPGILVSNRRIAFDDPDLRDLAPTILQLFGVPPPAEIEGRPLLKP